MTDVNNIRVIFCGKYHKGLDMRIELKDKELDKNVSLHFFLYETTVEETHKTLAHNARRIVKELLHDINENIADCFLQGDQKEWMMIEFWTSDLDKIMKAVEFVEERFSTKVQ